MKLTTLKNYVEWELGHPVEQADLEERFVWLIQEYHSMKGEFTCEDLDYIFNTDEEVYENLGFLVEHYEVQIWSGPAEEVEYCNNYFSWDAAYDGYKKALKDGNEYVRVVSVDLDGLPDGEIDKFSW